jgi:hypothetical protein
MPRSHAAAHPTPPAAGPRPKARFAGGANGDPRSAVAGLLPSQFFAAPDWRHAANGEVALRLAILEDAISCFERQFSVAGLRARQLGREAERWIFRDDRRSPFSYRSVCEAVGVEPISLRRWLLRRSGAGGAARAPRRRHSALRAKRATRCS